MESKKKESENRKLKQSQSPKLLPADKSLSSRLYPFQHSRDIFTTSANVIVAFDGAAAPTNPGFGGWGICVYKLHSDTEAFLLHTAHGFLGANVSNNTAELTAALRGLEWIQRHSRTTDAIDLCGDSQFALNEICGRYAVRQAHLVRVVSDCRKLLHELPNVRCRWIARDFNVQADELSKDAIAPYC